MQGRSFYLIRSLIIFAVIFFALQYGWEQSRNTALERMIINELTVAPAAWWVQRLWPDQIISAIGHSLTSPRFRINVLNGCEGLETLFLLIAAFAAYPFSWKARLGGVGLSILLIYFVNQARIVLLWWAIRHDPALFGLLHGTVLPLVLIAMALVFFVAFLPKQQCE